MTSSQFERKTKDQFAIINDRIVQIVINIHESKLLIEGNNE